MNSLETKKWIMRGVVEARWQLLKKHHWWPAALTVVLALCFVLVLTLLSATPDGKFLGISLEFWVGVSASVLAAGVVAILQQPTNFLNEAGRTVQEQQAKRFYDFGLLNLFLRRGDGEVIDLYRQSVAKATKRVWAFGMTNQQFMKSNLPAVLNSARKHENLDVVIGFWNPDAFLKWNDYEMTLSDVQSMLEKGTPVEANTQEDIKSRQMEIKRLLKEAKEQLRGRVRVVNVTLPTNFSAFVCDDRVFFFPFLSNGASMFSPMLFAASDEGLGKELVEHFEKLLSGKGVPGMLAEVIIDTDAPTTLEGATAGAVAPPPPPAPALVDSADSLLKT